jgi:hypothetical protein
MAKKTYQERYQDAQNKILKSFIDTLKHKDGTMLKSANEYYQVIDALNIKDQFSSKKTKNFMSLLIKILATKKQKQKYEELIALLKKDAKVYKCSNNAYKTYINRFVGFLENAGYSELAKKFDHKGLKWDAAAESVWGEEPGELYLHDVLYTKFKSRLRCQDRTSGDKIWLPLRFISKLYNKKNGRRNDFSKWLDCLVNGIFIHHDDGCGNIKSTKFGESDKLCLKLEPKSDDSKEFLVYLREYDENGRFKDSEVYTPTGKGNKKVPMSVKSVSDIDIDHVKPIDLTLKEKESYFKMLDKISDFYKDLQEKSNPNENEAAKELIERKKNRVNLKQLMEDLELIRIDSLLRLMDSKYNSQKSNGETFQKIIKKSETEYVGILECEEKICDDNGQRVYYYQKLTNCKEQNSFRVTTDGKILDGQVVEKLEEIIDFL